MQAVVTIQLIHFTDKNVIKDGGDDLESCVFMLQTPTSRSLDSVISASFQLVNIGATWQCTQARAPSVC